ncbi:85/88 kDa calcium-independent phospholipase A2 [Sarcoptes scabiei]|nr:85/88 kDa calcium-independent phospholipase A2 [Sarcoptes scabiei]
MNSHLNLKSHVDSIVNKSFLILDQIHESYFPFLEKSIYLQHTVEKIDRSKISKTEFIIQQRIEHVEMNCRQLEVIISKLLDSDPSKIDLINRLEQLEREKKRIWSSFKAIQLKRIEKERLKREQEESLTRRFTTNNSNNNFDLNDNGCPNQFNSASIDIEIENLILTKEKPHSSSATSSNLNLSMSMANKSRNQKQLVKKVRTRYLNLSTDFMGTTKPVIKYCSTWIWFIVICLFLSALILLIAWRTSFHQQRHYYLE